MDIYTGVWPYYVIKMLCDISVALDAVSLFPYRQSGEYNCHTI
jgi:hypothetical protein